jgi:hypothetical protein
MCQRILTNIFRVLRYAISSGDCHSRINAGTAMIPVAFALLAFSMAFSGVGLTGMIYSVAVEAGG